MGSSGGDDDDDDDGVYASFFASLSQYNTEILFRKAR